VTRETVSTLKTSLRERVREFGDRLFAGDEAVARQRGWTVTETWWGLYREYRDPIWDNFFRCGRCLGSGTNMTALSFCERCNGTGRIDRREQREE